MKLIDMLKVCSENNYEVCIYEECFSRFKVVNENDYMDHNVIDIKSVGSKLYIFVSVN